nr:hypothetical protein [Candidatus Sigynarchaeum springense]
MEPPIIPDTSDDQYDGWMTKEFIELIDNAVSLDFIIREIIDNDRKNPYYQSMMFMFKDFYKTKVLYERKVFSTNHILPEYQFLFGFKHKENMCLILEKPWHKVVACGDDLYYLNQNCFLVNGLQFILQEVENDKRWCYVPLCLCKHTQQCELTKRASSLRVSLWAGPKPM